MSGHPLQLCSLATGALIAGLLGCLSGANAQDEAWIAEPLPPGFRVEQTELAGPVFADPAGRTLYRWPTRVMRNGITGDQPCKPSNCSDRKTTATAGLMSPYPPGLTLPDLAVRPSCAEMWPPALAPADAEPVGAWSLVAREGSVRQWAYDGWPLYFSMFDRAPGDVMGGVLEDKDAIPELRVDFPAIRGAVGPRPRVPAGFNVITTIRGRQLVMRNGQAVYTSEKDPPGRSNCVGDCAAVWTPLIAPALARPQGDWSLVERAPGVMQWAFRNQPLYLYTLDPPPIHRVVPYLDGIDVPGWHAVYVRKAPPPPPEFTVQEGHFSQVLADAEGRTLYLYNCSDDALDQLSCDHPATTQFYRLAVCGGGDAVKCQDNWPPVRAAAGAKDTSRTWTVIEIDPATGRRAAAGQVGALRVWAYRDRPVYTFAGDRQPGDTNGDAIGEYEGRRNGFVAFRYRTVIDEPNN